MDPDSETLPPCPEPNTVDYFAGIVKLGISTFPDWGGPASELFGMIMTPILGRRRDEWFEQLRVRFNDLSRRLRSFTPQSLALNEEFISAMTNASSAALRTHAREKHQALQNAVLNVAAGSAPEDDLQSIFLSLIDSLTPLHLRLLRQFKLQTPVRIVEAPNWLKGDACRQVAKDLLDRGLIGMPAHLAPDRDRLIIGENGVYTFPAGLTRLGNQFLLFITSPPALD